MMTALTIMWEFEDARVRHDTPMISTARGDDFFFDMFEAAILLRGGQLNASFPFEPMLALLRGLDTCVKTLWQGASHATYNFLLEDYHIHFTKDETQAVSDPVIRVTTDSADGICETTLAGLDESVRDAARRFVADITKRYPAIMNNRNFLKLLKEEAFLSHIRLPA